MASYDLYMEYVRSPPFYYHHQCHHLQHHQIQRMDEAGKAAGWQTRGLGVERPSANSTLANSTPTSVVEGIDGSWRRPLPAFTIDAILSSTTTGSGIAEPTSGTELSHAQLQQTAAAGDTMMQLTRDASSLSFVGGTRSRVGRTSGKRVRTIFTQEQLDRLEKEFERQQYMVGTERCYLAAQLGLVEAQVKVWFQNRRIKWRRQAADAQRRHLAAAASADTCSSGSLVAGYPVLMGGPPSSSASVPHDTATSSSLSATSESSRSSSPDFDVADDFRFDVTGSATCNGGCDDVIDLRRTCV